MTRTQSFKDSNGHEWKLLVSIHFARRIAAELQVDIFAIFEEDAVFKDPPKLVDILECLLREQIEAAELDAEQFGEAMGGGVLEDAANALLKAVADFYGPRRKKVLDRQTDLAKAMTDRVLDEAAGRMKTAIVALPSSDGATGSLDTSD